MRFLVSFFSRCLKNRETTKPEQHVHNGLEKMSTYSDIFLTFFFWIGRDFPWCLNGWCLEGRSNIFRAQAANAAGSTNRSSFASFLKAGDFSWPIGHQGVPGSGDVWWSCFWPFPMAVAPCWRWEEQAKQLWMELWERMVKAGRDGRWTVPRRHEFGRPVWEKPQLRSGN